MSGKNWHPVDIAGMAQNLNQDKLKSDIDVEHVDDDFLFDHPAVDKTSDVDADIEEIQKLFRDMDTGSITNNKLDTILEQGNNSDSSFNSDLSDGCSRMSDKPKVKSGINTNISTSNAIPSGRPVFEVPVNNSFYTNTSSNNYSSNYSNNYGS